MLAIRRWAKRARRFWSVRLEVLSTVIALRWIQDWRAAKFCKARWWARWKRRSICVTVGRKAERNVGETSVRRKSVRSVGGSFPGGWRVVRQRMCERRSAGRWFIVKG